MTDRSDRERNAQQTHDSLVNALESIKGLLEQSENKLSAARASIAKAASPEARRVAAERSQLDIPVLDDVVIPSSDLAGITESINETLAAVHHSMPANPSTFDNEQLLAELEALQKRLEKKIRDSLMKSVVHIETGLKQVLQDEIEQIRKQILD